MLEQNLGRQGNFVDGHPRGIQNSISNGRGRRNHWRFPKGLVAVSGRGFKCFHEFTAHMGNIQGRWDLILGKIPVVDNPGFVIHHHFLEEGRADPHGHTPLDLSLGRDRVNDHAGIVNIDDVVDVNPAQGNVHRDIHEGTPETGSVGGGFMGIIRCDLSAAILLVVGILGKIGKRAEKPRRSRRKPASACGNRGPPASDPCGAPPARPSQ